jgi:hypothetical protein
MRGAAGCVASVMPVSGPSVRPVFLQIPPWVNQLAPQIYAFYLIFANPNKKNGPTVVAGAQERPQKN